MRMRRGQRPELVSDDNFLYIWLAPRGFTPTSIFFIGQRRDDSTVTLFRLDRTTQKVEAILAEAGLATLSVSADGRMLAYTVMPERSHFLYLRDLESGSTQPLGSVSAFVPQIIFSSDSQSIYVLADAQRNRQYVLWSVPLNSKAWKSLRSFDFR